MIIDAHAHIFPDKIAEKATFAIGDFYGIKMNEKVGTPEVLLAEGLPVGISKFVVHSTATTVKQVENINKYIISEIEAHDEFIGFMTLHPDMDESAMEKEVDFCINHGIRGVKLHPDFQKFSIDEPRAEKISRAVDARLPILFHTGDKRYRFSNPERLVKIAKKYPSQIVVGAHFGGYSEWESSLLYKGLDNVYFDTSSTLPFIDKNEAVKLLRALGTDRFFFGTDFPMWRPKDELERFFSLPLSEAERQLILHENFEKVFI